MGAAQAGNRRQPSGGQCQKRGYRCGRGSRRRRGCHRRVGQRQQQREQQQRRQQPQQFQLQQQQYLGEHLRGPSPTRPHAAAQRGLLGQLRPAQDHPRRKAQGRRQGRAEPHGHLPGVRPLPALWSGGTV